MKQTLNLNGNSKMYKDRKRYNKNGYVIVNIPEHPKAFNAISMPDRKNFCVYEHVVVAEEMLGRSLGTDEVVHHLDFNRSNNSPENLLVLLNSEHAKLHQWLKNFTLRPNNKQRERIDAGCIRCNHCEKPIRYTYSYCSEKCAGSHAAQLRALARGIPTPSKETLEVEIKQFSRAYLGRKYSVSATTIGLWCKRYGITLPTSNKE